DVRHDEIAGLVRDDRGRKRLLRFADDRHGGARNDEPLGVLHRAEDRAGDALRARERRSGEDNRTEDHRADEPQSLGSYHRYLRRRETRRRSAEASRSTMTGTSSGRSARL